MYPLLPDEWSVALAFWGKFCLAESFYWPPFKAQYVEPLIIKFTQEKKPKSITTMYVCYVMFSRVWSDSGSYCLNYISDKQGAKATFTTWNNWIVVVNILYN